MFAKSGIYVYPEGKNIRIFKYDGKSVHEYPSSTFGQKLVDFLNIEIIPLKPVLNDYLYKGVNNSDFFKFNTKDINRTIKLRVNKLYSKNDEIRYLLLNKIFDSDNVEQNFIAAIAELYLMWGNAWCAVMGSTANPTDQNYAVHIMSELLENDFKEVMFFTKLGRGMFTSKKIICPPKKLYYFDRIENYAYFLIFNVFLNNINIRLCHYCNKYFVSPNKRKETCCGKE